jgi:hypothetical protein
MVQLLNLPLYLSITIYHFLELLTIIGSLKLALTEQSLNLVLLARRQASDAISFHHEVNSALETL